MDTRRRRTGQTRASRPGSDDLCYCWLMYLICTPGPRHSSIIWSIFQAPHPYGGYRLQNASRSTGSNRDWRLEIGDSRFEIADEADLDIDTCPCGKLKARVPGSQVACRFSNILFAYLVPTTPAARASRACDEMLLPFGTAGVAASTPFQVSLVAY